MIINAQKRGLWLGLALLVLTGCSEPFAHANKLQEMDDFHQVAQQAKAQNIPIMIMFTAEHCRFCHQLEREVLNPMIRGGLYEGYAMMLRKVDTDLNSQIKFSDNESLSKRNFARMYRAHVTPTVIFVDASGKPVAEPLVGTMDVQLYAGLIHQRLNQAYTRMENPMRLPVSPDQMRRPLAQFTPN
ncbi:thioredoxin family protein [Thiomicrospira microaerophila]|uniref:thioredoxin family protein n=1 Tax=Thiomicrospira microaerophila TaxID=406020 RepID=UPI0005CA3A08|nr:thioredoxin fold domain-containing protein [Thiomicrospira microaerophila]